MKNQFLEAGEIVNTHGIQGTVKIVPWCDSPEFLCGFSTLYIDGSPVKVKSSSDGKGNILATFDGVKDVNDAMRLKGKTVFIDRTGVVLPEGRHFLADLIGLEVRDADSGGVLGTLREVITPATQQIYVVQGGETEHLIPAVDEFIIESNPEGGYMRVRLIEGM